MAVKPVVSLNAEQRATAVEFLNLAEKAGTSLWPRFKCWLSQDDAIAYAYVGLCKAIASYQPDKGSSLAAWVWHGCRQEVRDAAKDIGPLIHIPRHMFNQKKKREKVYKRAAWAAKAAQNRQDMERALRVDYWPLYDLDELTGATEPPCSMEC